MATVLIVDDAKDIIFSLGNIVSRAGYSLLTAASGKEALSAIKTNVVDLIFLDIGLPDISGIELIEQILDISQDSDIVMLTGKNDAKSALESLKNGAMDYIVKPFELIEFTTVLDRVMQSRLASKRILLHSHQEGDFSMISESMVMIPVKEAVFAASQVSAPVFITGETGTGKELAARAIHDLQKETRGVFVKVDCGTLSANLIESELFGYEKGAFTDAHNSKKGLVEIADGGTLFLDEIGNLPISLQPKLLRLIAESMFRRVGGTEDIQVSVRIIAATNTNIADQITTGDFRQDLFYRLNVIPIPLPPLRKRENDILLLADHFCQIFQRELKKDIAGFTPQARAALLAHDWPGNIRELRNLIEREVIFCKSQWISSLHTHAFTEESPSRDNGPLTLKQMEKLHIEKILKACDNNKSKAAKILGISRNTLRTKLSNGNFFTT